MSKLQFHPVLLSLAALATAGGATTQPVSMAEIPVVAGFVATPPAVDDVMDGFDILPRLVGAFYVFAGFVTLRALLMDHVLDQVLSGLSLNPAPARETRKRWLLGLSSLVVGASGAALTIMSLWAVPLFLLGSALQLVWLAWARMAFRPEDDEEARGRRQTASAALLYAGVTALTLWLAAIGQLHDWADPLAFAIPVVAIGLCGYLLRHLLWRAAPAPGGRDDARGGHPGGKPIPPRSVRLEPRWSGDDLVDADTGHGVPYDLYVSSELGDRIYRWACAFVAGDDHPDQQFWAEFASPQAEAAHRAEGAAIVAALETIFGPGNATGPVYPLDIRYLQARSESLD